MNTRIWHVGRKGRTGVLFLLAIAAMPSAAQDIKPLSSILSKSIATSGRKTVAVVDFTDLQGNVTELGRFLAEELSVDLVGNAKDFEVIERNQLKVILQEHRLSTTGLIDPQTARKLGQFAGVDALVTGTITAFGDTVRLSAKVLDTQTAKMIGAATSDIPRTKVIDELLTHSIGDSPQTSASTSDGFGVGSNPEPSGIVVEDGQLVFSLKGCTRSGARLTCTGSITNKAPKRRYVSVVSSGLVDNLGNQYRPESMGRVLTQELETNLPVNFSLTANDSEPAASLVTVLLEYRAGDLADRVSVSYTYSGKVALRNARIQGR